MKKAFILTAILLLSITLCFTLLPARAAAADDISIDEEHFPEDNFLIYIQDQLDLNFDNQLSEEEIAAVTSLKLDRYDFSDCVMSFKGIEYFTALTSFECDRIKLADLDFSKNTALTNLVLMNNDLTELDVSKNTALKTLNLHYNQLKTLDVSACPQLEKLDCDHNQLTELIIGEGKALTSLECNCNELTELDVSGFTALEKLDCCCNALTKLDVTHNTALTYLSCGENQLTALDVTHNKALKGFSCDYNQIKELNVTKCTKLVQFRCDNNRLSKLDVSKSTALTSLCCENNKLTELDVSRNTKLRDLRCEGNSIAKLDIRKCSGLVKVFLKGSKRVDGKVVYYDFMDVTPEGPIQYLLYVRKGTEIRSTAVPKVTTQPRSVSTAAGKTVTFKVKATGGLLKYQWYVMKKGTSKWVKITNATSASYKITAKKKLNGYSYRCKVTNTAGKATSKAAKLTVR